MSDEERNHGLYVHRRHLNVSGCRMLTSIESVTTASFGDGAWQPLLVLSLHHLPLTTPGPPETIEFMLTERDMAALIHHLTRGLANARLDAEVGPVEG